MSARPIRRPVRVPDDLEGLFDGITYEKGAAVIAMIERWAGAERFRRALRAYLAAHRHGTVAGRDLHEALGRATGADAPRILSGFLERPGVPLVALALDCRAAPRVRLRQERAVLLGQRDADPRPWVIPVCLAYGVRGGSATRCTLLAGRELELVLDTPECPSWVLGNDDGLGYYRVQHEGGLHDALARAPLSVAERVGVLGDAGFLVAAGRLAPRRAVAAAVQAAGSGELALVEASVRLTAGLGELVSDPARAAWAAFVRATYAARARALGWTPRAGEGRRERLLRPTLLALLGDDGEDGEIQAGAERRARAWLLGRRDGDPELASLALELAALRGDASLLQGLVTVAKRGEPRDQRLVLSALGRFEQPGLLRRAVASAAAELPPGDVVRVLGSALDGRRTRTAALRLLVERWDAEWSRLAPDDLLELLGHLGGFCDDGTRASLAAFFGPRVRALPGATAVLEQALERVAQCARLRATVAKDLADAVRSHVR